MQVGDLVRHATMGNRKDMKYPNEVGIVVGFDSEYDPIIYFTYRNSAVAFYLGDVEVINESR
jgi:hypothetical protein